MILVKLCILIASTTNTPQIVTTDEVRFTSTQAQDLYRCEYVKRSELNDVLRAKGIKRYQRRIVL